MTFAFDNSFHRTMEGFYAACEPDAASKPELVAFNDALAAELGLDRSGVSDAELAALLSGAALPDGAQPIALTYAGHQFGQFNPQLGDGRAHLLGEIVAPDARRFDIQLKGSGRTPYSRGGDGKAALGPVLREYLVSEAMHALGIPTTRSLAAVKTGDGVFREVFLPGAVLTRVAASHIRVGTFAYFAAHHGADAVRQLSDHAIARHYPAAADATNPYLAFFEAVVEAQAALIARWMQVGFVHGVMNTDNCSIAGETIDYGPCAFLDRYAADTVFSSIDRQGRYAFGNQPGIARWNMHRLAEALAGAVHAIGGDEDVAKLGPMIDGFADHYFAYWLPGMRAKIGLAGAEDGDMQLVLDLLKAMEAGKADFTLLFRSLSQAQAGDDTAALALFEDLSGFDLWLVQWHERLARDPQSTAERTAAMEAVNPLYIARNHKVEEALASANGGNYAPFFSLLEVVQNPYIERVEWANYALPAPDGTEEYVTFCGT
ncbi:MAG: YdiU family protein [Sphingorhabdus sp.]